LKYIDPSGLRVEFPNEDYVSALLEYPVYLSSGSPLGQLVQEWAELRLVWEDFNEKAPRIAEMLEESKTVFTFKGMVEAPGDSTRSLTETVGQVIFDAVGYLYTAPNTLLGLKLATMSNSASLRFGPGGTFLFEDIDTSSATGQLMENVLGTSALTVGYVIFTTDPTIDPDILVHELGHVTQAAILGPAYLPSYGIGWLLGGWLNHDLNAMESWLLPNWPRR
jgi:hypothetical protein